MLEGLEALHAEAIVHRDIKCANVFLQKNGGVKLGDMNVSTVSKSGMMQTQTGTPFYCPPEVFKNESYNKKCDIWSLGCVIYELTALKPPFLAKDIGSLQKKVIKGDYPKIPRHFSNDLAEVLGNCLVLDPQVRYSAWELL